jgi:SAM-dependent methyltransferase
MTDSSEDIPSPIDLREAEDARAWAEAAMRKRPSREEFFRAIVRELHSLDANRNNSSELAVLELGSGPGFLARHILEAFPAIKYCALDFSPAMHELAREDLGELPERAEFVEKDFKSSNWMNGLPQFDAVVSMQVVHELRHKRHAPELYRAVRQLLRENGIFLVCDHFVGDGGMTDTALYMTRQEHVAALRIGGFTDVRLILQKGGLVLFRAAASA